MVMVTGNVCSQYAAGELSHEVGEPNYDACAEATALHERLVAYVHALGGAHEPRSGVWVEHSYARARGAVGAPAAHVRVLLAPRVEPEPELLDVERVDPPPPELPIEPAAPDLGDEDDDDEDDWEARVTTLAPSAAHARLADRAVDALRRLRLALLAGGGALERASALRSAARRLRLALAAAAPHARSAAWLHSTLTAVMPRGARRLYGAVAAELVRQAPRLARVLACEPAGAGVPACAGGVPSARRPAGGAGPLLVWLGCGRARQDARWAARLGALLALRQVAAPAAAAAAPDAWCAAVAGSMRAALADTLAETGDRPVILGGLGAGATLCAALAGGAAGAGRVRGLLLLAPHLLTAEGARDAPDDALAELRLPLLLVVGTGAAQAWRGAAAELARPRPGAGPRRVLELRGADDALRLPLAARRRLPQHALDAAVAEECARWALEAAEGGAGGGAGAGGSPPRERPRRRAHDLRLDRLLANDDADEEEYAHLPATISRSLPTNTPQTGSDRTVEIIGEYPGRTAVNSSLDPPNCVTIAEGRVVSRGSGATPLALLPPRRRAATPPDAPPAPPAPPAPLAPADILRLPIVFADDEPDAAAPRSPVTVTSGVPRARGPRHLWARGSPAATRGSTVASRGSPAATRGSPAATRGSPGTTRGSPAAARGNPADARGSSTRYTRVIVASRGRPVLLRRGVRLLPRDAPH